MSAPAMSLAPFLIDSRTTAKVNSGELYAELFERAGREDYPQWLSVAVAAGGCVRPIRLRGTIRDLDPASGEVVHTLDTEDTPDKVIYLPCGDRRASICPPCAQTYRADIYQLIRAGLAGGKGMPESVSVHPCVFATFTAPSFGAVHTRVELPGGGVTRCRPRRRASYCPHGRRLSCGQRHKEDDACLGQPLCPDCYDYNAAVVWNAHAPELWRRTIIALRRRLAKEARAYGVRVRLSYAKVAEFQRRGLIHFHAIFRLDGVDPVHPERTVAPHPAFTAELLADIIGQVASNAWFATVSHPMKPNGWDITWGVQIDPLVVQLTGPGEITDVTVASYLAKYATKSTESVGLPPGRITLENASAYADSRTHEGRLIRACLRIGADPHEDFKALRRWAHMLGYRGHFATKSRRYSTTMRALRAARRDWHRRQHPHAQRYRDQAIVTVTDLEWAGRGWRTTGDALLALSAAARAREHRRIAREEMSIAS
ncbi:MAG TPA: replication initiator [Streptosporangiaceae bacterium]